MLDPMSMKTASGYWSMVLMTSTTISFSQTPEARMPPDTHSSTRGSFTQITVRKPAPQWSHGGGVSR